MVAGDRKWTPQKQALAGGVDLVVGTPGRVLSHVQAGTISLRNCHTVVIDEVDVLLGDQHAFAAQVSCSARPENAGPVCACWRYKVWRMRLNRSGCCCCSLGLAEGPGPCSGVFLDKAAQPVQLLSAGQSCLRLGWQAAC